MSKIAIVGCQQSGKTVFMASLSDYFRAGQRDNQSSWLIPENADAHNFTEKRHYEMRVKHEWPRATSVFVPVSLKWSLHLKNGDSSDVEMLEFGGEVFRAAFKEDGADPQNREAAEKLVSYLIDAKFVVVLVAMKELFRNDDDHDRYVDEDIESTWVTRGLIDFVKKNLPKDVGLLVALTQADLYKKELDEMGGPVGVLKKKWPMIYALYPNLPVVSVASVSKTTADGRPAEGYTTEGVLPVMKAFSEYLYGNPTGLIAELDDIVTAVCSMQKPLAIDVLEKKLGRHARLVEELRNKVTIVDALYDDVITRHTEFNQATSGLLTCLKSLLSCRIEDQQSDKTWSELRERFPTLMPAIAVYQRESREQYADLLARREREAEEERKRREAEELRIAEEAKKDEERKRQLELKEKEQRAAAEDVRIERERSKTASRVLAIKVAAVLVILGGLAFAVKVYFEKRTEAELAEKSKIERDSAIKLALAKEKEDAARIILENNRKEELRKQQIEAENKRKELELKEKEAARQREAELASMKEKELARQKAADEKAAAEARQKAAEAENAKRELERREAEARRLAEDEAARKKREIAERKAKEEELSRVVTGLLDLSRNAESEGSLSLLAKYHEELAQNVHALKGSDRETFDSHSRLIDLWQNAKDGDASAMFKLGEFYFEKNPLAAQKWYSDATEAGDVTACVRLGELCMKQGAQTYNPAKAFALYKKAADQGNVRAQVRLANMMSSGIGTVQDQKAANEWYKTAAQAKDIEASIALAKRLAKGEGFGAPDFDAAYTCLERVLENDTTGIAHFELGNLYENTIRANRRFSIDKAQLCYLKAKEKGFTNKEMEKNLKIYTKIIQERKNPAVPE